MNLFIEPVPMPDATQHRLIKKANAAGAKEICGFVTKDWEIHPIENKAENPYNDFLMHPDDLRDFLSHRWNDIIGIYHSHPVGDRLGARPSRDDISQYPGNNWRYFIVYDGNVHEWQINVHDGSVTHIGDTQFVRVAPSVSDNTE